jgi:transcriptional regulator with XRE-family HTH domain
MTQSQAADRAGVSQGFWSYLERGGATTTTLETLASCASAVHADLAAFLQALPGADLPRDVEHLRRQQLVIAIARGGGWTARPERPIDPEARRSRSIDVELERAVRRELAVVEIWDLVTDGGDAMRSFADKIAAVRREAPPGWTVSGLFVLRATSRNRALVRQLPDLFASRFAGSSTGWLAALGSPQLPVPLGDGLLWTNVAGTRLHAARLGGKRTG